MDQHRPVGRRARRRRVSEASWVRPAIRRWGTDPAEPGPTPSDGRSPGLAFCWTADSVPTPTGPGSAESTACGRWFPRGRNLGRLGNRRAGTVSIQGHGNRPSAAPTTGWESRRGNL